MRRESMKDDLHGQFRYWPFRESELYAVQFSVYSAIKSDQDEISENIRMKRET